MTSGHFLPQARIVPNRIEPDPVVLVVLDPRFCNAFSSGGLAGGVSHNLTYYQRLLADARAAIEADRFEEFLLEKSLCWSCPLGV